MPNLGWYPQVLCALAKGAQAEWCHSSAFSITWVLHPVYCSLQGWKERWKRPSLLISASGSVFPPVLYSDFFSLCAGHYLDVALVVCMSMQTLFISVCLPCYESLCPRGLSLCVPVHLSTHVFSSCFCVFDALGFEDASACACLYAANVCVYLCLSDVYVYSSEHAFISLLLTSTEGCAKVSLRCTFPLGVTHSCSSQASDWQCLFLTCCLEQNSPKRISGTLDEPKGCLVNEEGKNYREMEINFQYVFAGMQLFLKHTMFFFLIINRCGPLLSKSVVDFLGKMVTKSHI